MGAAETWLSVTCYKDSYCETQKPGDQSGFLTTSDGRFCYKCLAVQTEGWTPPMSEHDMNQLHPLP